MGFDELKDITDQHIMLGDRNNVIRERLNVHSPKHLKHAIIY